MATNVRQPRPSQVVIRHLINSLDEFLAAPESLEDVTGVLEQSLPEEVISHSRAILNRTNGLSYRDGLLIQLAWGLVGEEKFDHTRRGEGGRSVAQALGRANAERHIPKVNDAFENIGKNTPELARGNVAEFDTLLSWMNAATRQQRDDLLTFLVASVAKTARPVLAMPELARPHLTFARVSSYLDELLSTGSGGAYEQFAVAAFLGALIDEFGLGGVSGLSVRTKNINASDASAGAAGDVQVIRGNRIEEAFEISANHWSQKLTQAIGAAKSADLTRAHIVARDTGEGDLVALLSSTTADISVIELRSFLRTLCAILRKPSREDALRRLYDFTDRLQPDVQRTNRVVQLLSSHGLTA